MEGAFRPEADFTPIGASGFHLSDVMHRTRLEVDEEGTVAAAATAVGVAGGISPPQTIQPKVLVFDRPFALILYDRATKAIIFAGVVYDPQP
jgi:serpin B